MYFFPATIIHGIFKNFNEKINIFLNFVLRTARRIKINGFYQSKTGKFGENISVLRISGGKS